MQATRALFLLAAIGLSGCTGLDRNADCRFPYQDAPLSSKAALDEEALLAEDLAIRFADQTAGSRSRWPQGRDGYRRVREQCKATLFGIVARRYGVSPQQVDEATSHRDLSFDAIVLIAFVSLYALVVTGILRRLRSGGLGSRAWTSMLATAGVSMAIAPIAALVWTVWAGLAESIRLGNGHVSYRAARVPGRDSPFAMVIVCLAMFWIVALWQAPLFSRRQAAR